MTDELERRLAAIVDDHVRDGRLPPREALAETGALGSLVEEYLALSWRLHNGPAALTTVPSEMVPPVIPGFRVVERIGAGGMGEVYKIQDLKLQRFVAAKVVRRDRRIGSGLADFLGEARSLALFKDRRIVQIFEYRADADPPVIIMEFVEGFELGRLGPSLEFAQRARILWDVCEAIQHAHDLGLQHRDLKPSNIMVDGSLTPKILDFGLSAGDPWVGHFRGTLLYLAPEQLDRASPIDARTDVYALGVILYTLLSGVAPFDGAATAEVLAAIRSATPRLPIEIDARVPEPLQAVALKAMERRPADRYRSAHEMALDLDRYLEGRPVTARPTQYLSTLSARVSPHVEQIGEWLRLKLIYPHEAERLRSAYQHLDAPEDDWIGASRALSYSQIALYFGAFLLFAGALFYFVAHRFFGAVTGLAEPLAVLGGPFIGLNAAGRHLYRTDRRAAAVAFFLAGVTLLPLFLLIWFHEAGIWVVPADAPGQLLAVGSVSNHQLEVTTLVAALWSAWLALRTRTIALSTVSTVLGCLCAVSVLADFGLRGWIDDQRADLVALHLWPLIVVYAALGLLLERAGRTWFAGPVYVAGVCTLVAVLDFLALDGRTFHYLGVTMQGLQGAQVSSPSLIDTVAALTLNGLTFYLVASVLWRSGHEALKVGATLLFVISPFSTLEPLAYLAETGEYSRRFDWIYLFFAMTTAVVSHQRQRKSFYYAGLINTGVALYFIADHRHWFDKTTWAVSLVVAGIALLLAGFALGERERRSL